MSQSTTLFRSFIQAGFECSCHRNCYGQRLDLLHSTGHKQFLREDFERLKALGIYTVRSAINWPRIERSPRFYDFSAESRMLDTASQAGIELVLDILHFGWPDHIDVFSPDFPQQLAALTDQFVRVLNTAGYRHPRVAPVNEISYLSWAGAEKAAISPHTLKRGAEFKRNLVRAAVASSDVLLEELPGCRLIAPEPAINIIGDPFKPGDQEEADAYTLAYFESWDMLSGRLHPELGGRPDYLDVIGVNYYERNQWLHNSTWIPRTHPQYRHFHRILKDIWDRYHRPMFVAETGTEDDRRASWFEYICDEVELALRAGVPIHGVCWYPIANHPGWDDDRHCHNGVFDYADEYGNRETYEPLANAILGRQARLNAISKEYTHDHDIRRPDLFFSSPMGLCVPAAATSDEPLRPQSSGLLL